MHNMTEQAAKGIVDAFNQIYTRGHPVLVVLDSGKWVQTKTNGPAHNFQGNLMVNLVGHGKYKLDRVIPLPAHKATPIFTMPDPPPDKVCDVCGDKLDIAHAQAIHGAGWFISWNCAEQCDEPGIEIDWPFAVNYATQDDMYAAGFTISE